MSRSVEQRPSGVRPFSSGTEGYDWLEANCERCAKKGEPDAMGNGPCPMETAVSLGFIIGTIPAALAVEYGATLSDEPGFCKMPRQCSQHALSVTTCESKSTRNRRPCGKPATATVEAHGLTRAVCDHHRKTYLAACEDEAKALSPSPKKVNP